MYPDSSLSPSSYPEIPEPEQTRDFAGIHYNQGTVMQIIGIIWGIISIIGMFIFFLPLLGWLNWIHIPFSLAGLIVNIVAIVMARGSKTTGIIGFFLCLIAIIVGFIRIQLGMGLL